MAWLAPLERPVEEKLPDDKAPCFHQLQGTIVSALRVAGCSELMVVSVQNATEYGTSVVKAPKPARKGYGLLEHIVLIDESLAHFDWAVSMAFAEPDIWLSYIFAMSPTWDRLKKRSNGSGDFLEALDRNTLLQLLRDAGCKFFGYIEDVILVSSHGVKRLGTSKLFENFQICQSQPSCKKVKSSHLERISSKEDVKAKEADVKNGDAVYSNSPFDDIKFLRLALQLKRQKRTGWVLRNIDSPESVADHSYGVALCSLLVRDETSSTNKVDWRKACLMGLVHDLAEAIVGDFAPGQTSEAEKHRLEQEAMQTLVHDTLKGSQKALELEALWQEYEKRETAEAKLVKDLDRFEMILQADTYEQSGQAGKNLQEFFDSVKGKIKHPLIQRWQAALESERAKR